MKKRITPTDALPGILTPRMQTEILCRRDLAAVKQILRDLGLPIERRGQLAEQVLRGLVAKLVWAERLNADVKMPPHDDDE